MRPPEFQPDLRLCALATTGWEGCTSCPGGALTHFPYKLRLKKIFTAMGVLQVHPFPLATPMFTRCTANNLVLI